MGAKPNDEGQLTRDEGRRKGWVFRLSSFVLASIIVAYLGIGTLYAIKTPAWQVPDEPAHYNYVRFVAEGRGLPVLQPGDYDQAYLESIKANKFLPSMPIDSIRYEFWQPPLYYVLAAPIYLATGGSLLALRLFSVALGGCVVVLSFLIVRRLVPDSCALALGSAAFVAFVPQHVAMMAGAQNDSMAESLLALSVLQILNLKFQISNLKWVMLGLTLGLALVTKGTVYIAAPLAAVAMWLAYRQADNANPAEAGYASWRAIDRPSLYPPDDKSSGGKRCNWKWLIKCGAFVFVPALVIALPWWIRNLSLYGWPDFLGSIRHDAVVLGQPTPAEWIARFGLGGYLRDLVVTTFHSFWGQFGWMGVPMNDRNYAILAVCSLVVLVGWLWYLTRNARTAFQNSGFWLLGSWILFATLVYVGYNVKYVQFQGRYLFPALIPIGLAFTIGFRQWITWLPRNWRDVVLAIPFIGLAALCWIALFRMIVPALTP